MARKAIEWTPAQQKQFKDLCSIFCTRAEICTVMAVSEKTLNRLVNKYFHDEVAPEAPKSQKITFEDAFDHFSGAGRASLRRQMFSLAMAGDRQMLTILSKNYLGLTDRTAVKQEITVEERKPSEEAREIDVLFERAAKLGMPAANTGTGDAAG